MWIESRSTGRGSHAVRRGWWSIGLVAICVAGLGGCGPGAEGRRSTAYRWIESDAQEFLDRASFVTETTRFEYQPASWRPASGIASMEPRAGRVDIEIDESAGVLVREVDFEASEVDVVEIPASGVKKLSFRWAAEGEELSDEREIVIWPTIHEPRPLAPHRLEMRGRADWSGRIRRLGLTIERKRRINVAKLGTVRGVAEGVSDDRLASAVNRAWKVDIDGDVRNSLLALPGIPNERELVVPEAAKLRFGYGVERRLKATVRFKVSIGAGRGAREEVFGRSATGGPKSVWSHGEVDLAPWAGQRVRVVFETQAAPAIDARDGFPVWSNLEVLPPARGRRPNLVLISIDTLRADRLSIYGHPRQTSPSLDAWARESAVVFSAAVAQAPWTLPSHLSLFTGLEAFHHGANHRRTAPLSLVTLAEYLRDEGYLTMAVTGGGFVHPKFGFCQGFDSYRYWSDRRQSERELEVGIDQALELLRDVGDRPFFLFFHTFEVHAPYRARQPHFDRLSGDEVEDPHGEIWVRERDSGFRRGTGYFVLNETDGERREIELREADLPLIGAMYDSGVAYMDEQLDRLIDRVEQIGNTTVVFTSDHGETLGERGDGGHGLLDEANVMVPLIVAFADGLGAGREVPVQVRLIDVLPTILEHLDIAPAASIDGESLLPLVRGKKSYAHRPAWCYVPAKNLGIALRVDDRFKYVFNDTAWDVIYGEEELYDLEEDPGEERNLAGASDRIDGFRKQAAEALEGAAGLRLMLTNLGPSAFDGHVRSSAIQPARVKRLPLESGAVFWDEPGSSEIVVEEGQSLTINFLNVSADAVVVEGGFSGGSGPRSSRVELAVPSTGSAARFNLTTDGWQADGGDSATTLMVVELWRIGAHEVNAREPSAADPELQERLRALGYLQ